MTGRRSASRYSLGSVANGSTAVAVVVLLIGAGVIAVSFANLLSARERVFTRLEPALVQREKLRTSLLDQETGIRGFALTRDERLLEPYVTGQAEEERLTASIRRLLGDEDGATSAQLDAIGDASAEWRSEVADPLVEAPAPDGVDTAVLRSKLAFDRVRGEVDGLEDVVLDRRSSARNDLDAATTTLSVTVGVALVAVTVAGLFGAWLLRRRVVVPIEELVAQSASVDRGQFDTVIDVQGPREIEQLAQRVDDMRVRLLDELAAVEAAKVELDLQRQTLARSNRDLEQFAYVASHDLQEPLRKVASFCQLLEQRYGDQFDEKGRLYLDYAVDGAKRMQALISDLLDFSRVGRTTAGFVDCDLGTLAASVVDSYSGPIADTGAIVEIGDLPTVPGDPSLLAALIQNLLANALKYRSAGVLPHVSLTAEPGDGHWGFVFTDNGIGIEEAFRERVFVIFQRLHSRDAFEGTGIGLALCKKIVEFHGGEIWIADAPPDGGTVVRWTLPTNVARHEGYAAADGAQPGAAPAPPPAQPLRTVATSSPEPV